MQPPPQAPPPIKLPIAHKPRAEIGERFLCCLFLTSIRGSCPQKQTGIPPGVQQGCSKAATDLVSFGGSRAAAGLRKAAGVVCLVKPARRQLASSPPARRQLASSPPGRQLAARPPARRQLASSLPARRQLASSPPARFQLAASSPARRQLAARTPARRQHAWKSMQIHGNPCESMENHENP
jgi:hypothetical protein